MSALALAAWRDWRDRVALPSLAPALALWILAASFGSLGPFLLSAAFALSFACGGWFAGRRYGPGSFGKERLAAAALDPPRTVLALGLASTAMCLSWLALAAAPALFTILSFGMESARLPLLALSLSGIWQLSFGAAFLAARIRRAEDSAAGAVFALAWILPASILPFLRWLNPFQHAWSAFRGFSAWPALGAWAAELVLGTAFLYLGASRQRGEDRDAVAERGADAD